MKFTINQKVYHYRIVDFVGAGGMGEVYRAVQDSIERVVALKILSAPQNSDSFTQRFLNEARIHSRLQHPNIVLLYDFFEYDGLPCIAMEYVSGKGLDQVISEQGSLHLSDATVIFKKIVSAITYIHGHDVLHRDIKPANVRITPSGDIKLLDFGVAKDMEGYKLTQTGHFIGTLQYLSPEQLAGKGDDLRSDIWALGILFYEMLTGQLPFEANSLAGFLDDINHKDFIKRHSFSQLPEDAKQIILRCLKNQASKRFPSAEQLEVDVDKLLLKLTSPHRVFVPKKESHRFNKHLAFQVSVILLPIIILVLIISQIDSNQPVNPRANISLPIASKKLNKQQELVTFRISIQGNHPQALVYDAKNVNEPIGATPFDTEAAVGSEQVYILKSKGYRTQRVPVRVQSIQNDRTISLQKENNLR